MFSLPNGFFEENVVQFNSNSLAITRMFMFEQDGLFNRFDDIVSSTFSSERKEEVAKQKAEIEAISTSEELVRYMKIVREQANVRYLCKLAAELDAYPAILEKLKKAGVDFFIEAAMLALSVADEKYIDQVATEFRSYRNQYARVAATGLLAFRGREDALEQIYQEFMDSGPGGLNTNLDRQKAVLYSLSVLAGPDKGLTKALENDTDGAVAKYEAN